MMMDHYSLIRPMITIPRMIFLLLFDRGSRKVPKIIGSHSGLEGWGENPSSKIPLQAITIFMRGEKGLTFTS
jgi:hypothetical protein